VILRRDNGAAVIVYTTANGRVVRLDYGGGAQPATVSNVFETPPLIAGAKGVATTPAVIDDGNGGLAIFVAIGNGVNSAKVFRLDGTTGVVEDESVNLGTDIKSSPSVAIGSIYVGATGGSHGAYRLSTANLATPLNDYAPGKSSTAPPFILQTENGAQQAYLSSDDGVVYAVNPATGNPEGGFGRGGSVTLAEDVLFSGGPFVADGVVYLGGSNNTVYALDASTGAGAGPQDSTVFFEASADGSEGAITGGFSLTRPITGGTAIVFGSTNGRVYQVRTTDPEIYQVTLTDTSGANAVTTAPTVAASMFSIFVGNDNGRVFRVPVYPLSIGFGQ
jgi:outer membrane protein assembly factor BamB